MFECARAQHAQSATKSGVYRLVSELNVGNNSIYQDGVLPEYQLNATAPTSP